MNSENDKQGRLFDQIEKEEREFYRSKRGMTERCNPPEK